jgi:hypothetical protein
MASKMVPSFSMNVARRFWPPLVPLRAVTPSAIIAAVGAAVVGANVTALTPRALRLSYHASISSTAGSVLMTAP